MTELEKLGGSGNEGRVTKKDILEYVNSRKSGGASRETRVISQAQEAVVYNEPVQPETRGVQPSTTYSGNVEIIEMDRMRKLIARHMVESKHTSAHVTSFTEADVTNMVQWRDRIKKDF